MLKLKKNVREFIKANLKPDYGKRLLWAIEHKVFTTSHFSIDRHETLNGVDLSLQISASDFEQIEELKPYKWHPAESWDGNPNGYWILNFFTDWSLELYTENIDKLCDLTTHFMYIEPLEVEDDAS